MYVSAYSTFQSVVCPSAAEYAALYSAGLLIAANLQCNLCLSLVHRCIYVSLHRIGSQAEPYSMTRGEAPYAAGLRIESADFFLGRYQERENVAYIADRTYSM